MSATAAEIDFLLYSCRLEPDLDIDQKLQQLPETFDWELLVNTSFDHGVTALLCRNLLSATADFIPTDIHHAAATFLRQQTETNQQQADQLSTILSELNSIDIPAIPFKGMTLAMNAYGALNLRTSRDLDFLIQHRDISACIDKLEELGYSNEQVLTPRQWQEFVKYTCEEILFGPGVPLEPHWSFTPRTLAIKMDYPAIWKRSNKVCFNGHSVLSLSVEDELIALCLHGCKEQWSKLKWVVDLAEFIRSHPSLNWQDLKAYAASQHITRIVKISILLSHIMTEIRIPDSIHRWIDSDSRAKSLANQLASDFFSRDTSHMNIWKPALFRWSMRERFADRLLYFFLTITQPRVQHFADINIPDRFFLLYWPYKIIHDYLVLPLWKIVKKFVLSSFTMKPAEQVSVFFLGEEGILFDDSAQALYRLNTSAAFIWCLLEEACTEEAILEKLISTFKLSRETASEYFEESEKTFKSLGVIQGFEKSQHSPVDTIENEGVAEYDDRQFVLNSRYRLLSSRIHIRYSDTEQKNLIDPVLNHLTDSEPVEPTTTIDILKDFKGRITLCRDRIPQLYCDSLEQLAPNAKGLVWQTAVNAHDFFLDVHAGVVGDGKQCYIMPASPGSGKSSLTLALTYHGFEFFSDEVALLFEEDFQVESVPLAACVKDTGVQTMLRYYPQLQHCKQHQRDDGKLVRYLPPPVQSTPPQGLKRPVGAIIFPQYDPTAETCMTPLSKTDALLKFIQECLVIDTQLDKNRVTKLLNWIEKTPCYKLITTDLEEAVQCIRNLSNQ